MLFLVEIALDADRLSAHPDPKEVEDSELAIRQHVKDTNMLRGAWRLVDGTNLFVCSVGSHQEIADLLQGLPVFKYIKRLNLTPLLPHPAHPQFSTD